VHDRSEHPRGYNRSNDPESRCSTRQERIAADLGIGSYHADVADHQLARELPGSSGPPRPGAIISFSCRLTELELLDPAGLYHLACDRSDPWEGGCVISLARLVEDFATAIQRADGRRPQAAGSRTGRVYQPGIGPHTESQTIRLVTGELVALDHAYAAHALDVPYPGASRQRCDWCLGSAPSWDWALEAKMLRLLGDNGKLNDNVLMHVLSPYPAHRSALTDREKLVRSGMPGRKAIVIFGYDYDDWPMDPAIEAFETLALQRVALGDQHVAAYDQLVHPVHLRGRVFAWEVGTRTGAGSASRSW
jgi:hypothetical protein